MRCYRAENCVFNISVQGSDQSIVLSIFFELSFQIALQWTYTKHATFASVFFGCFSGAESYEMVTNVNLDNTGLANLFHHNYIKMWYINELEEEHIKYI